MSPPSSFQPPHALAMHSATARRRCMKSPLSRVQFHNHLLIDGQSNLILRRQSPHSPLEAGLVQFQPFRNSPAFHRIQGCLNRDKSPAPLAHSHHITCPHLCSGNVGLPAVHRHMPVTDELTRFLAGSPKSQPIGHVVQPALKQSQERLAGHPGLPLRPFEHSAELGLHQSVNSSELLFLTELRAVVGDSRPSLPMLPRRIAATFDGTFFGHTARAFQKQFLALSPTQPTDRTAILSHFSTSGYRTHPQGWVQTILSDSTIFTLLTRPGAVWAAGSHCAESGSRPESS